MPSALPSELRGATRILLYGVTGSGKTTAADRIGDVLGLPSHHVDDEIGWLPHWAERPEEDQKRLAKAMAAGDRWVIDSAYGKWRESILERAQCVVALDYPRRVSLGRLIHRSMRRLLRQEAMCNGNYESLGRLLGHDSIIRWRFRSFDRKREVIAAMESANAGPPVVRVRSQSEFDALLKALS